LCSWIIGEKESPIGSRSCTDVCFPRFGAAGRSAGRSRCARRRSHRWNSRRRPWRCHRCFGWSRYRRTYCEPRSARPRSSLVVARQLLLPRPQRQMVSRVASILPLISKLRDGSRRENVVSKQCRRSLVLVVVLLSALAVPAVAALPALTSLPIPTERRAGVSLWRTAARAGVGVPDHRPHKLRRTAKHKVAASR
jgi:hypothetical protein